MNEHLKPSFVVYAGVNFDDLQPEVSETVLAQLECVFNNTKRGDIFAEDLSSLPAWQ
jgi:hypothetical protein